MANFFFDYGLFTAKFITLVIVFFLGLFCFVILLSHRRTEEEAIEIEKVNDRLDALKEALEEEIYSKDEFKSLLKERKKKEKEEEKERKKRSKKGEPEPTRTKLFVLNFIGDMNASEVDNLRECVTAILSVATKEDEVLVVLESAGGLVHNYGLGASQLQRIRQREIPLTVIVDLIAASGGYLMASVANKILAAPFAVVGSVGVLAQLPNFNRFLEKHEIDIEQHTAGEYKTTLTMLGKNTEKAREKFIQELDEVHVLFKQFVLEHRPVLDIQKVATGEHWYGQQAIELKLIDGISTSDDYLLEKSKTTDIYEVNYVIHESFSQKLSNIIHGFSCQLKKLLSLSPFGKHHKPLV